jgi:hypothetical protein
MELKVSIGIGSSGHRNEDAHKNHSEFLHNGHV